MLSNCLLTLVNLGGLSFLLARTDAQLSVEQTIKPVTVSVAQVVTLTPDFGGPTSRPKTWYVWKVGSVSSEHGVLRSTLQGFLGSWNVAVPYKRALRDSTLKCGSGPGAAAKSMAVCGIRVDGAERDRILSAVILTLTVTRRGL